MKKIVLFLLITCSTFQIFAKKDINAWKNEKTIDQQFIVFKQNLKYWNGSYFFQDPQLDQLYNALMDSVSVFKNEKIETAKLNASLQNELNFAKSQMQDTKAKLDESLKRQNAISVFGIYTNKNVYTLIMSGIIMGLLGIIGLFFLLNKRSRIIAREAKRDYDELKEEFEIYKKNSLARYTQINTELHHTRLELNRKVKIRS